MICQILIYEIFIVEFQSFVGEVAKKDFKERDVSHEADSPKSPILSLPQDQ
jgi:hypothetical protein